MAEGRSQPSLGEYLVREGFISQADFNEAHQLQLETSRSLGRILVDAGKITESMRLNLLSKRFGYPHLRPEGTISPELLNLIPQSFAEKHRAVPISLADDLLTVAMEDPSDMLIVDAIKNQVGLDVRAGVASREDIDRVLSQYGAAAAAAPAQTAAAPAEKPRGLVYRAVRALAFPIIALAPLVGFFVAVYYHAFGIDAYLEGLTAFDRFVYIALVWGLWTIIWFEINALIFHRDGRDRDE
ncbi:MAG TPA: hypothetical protein PK847_08460 [Candidatus Sumerlaeota bacterium]|nr:hypothetical protein [Candidatus Sumerlaeota bacterium]